MIYYLNSKVIILEGYTIMVYIIWYICNSHCPQSQPPPPPPLPQSNNVISCRALALAGSRRGRLWWVGELEDVAMYIYWNGTVNPLRSSVSIYISVAFTFDVPTFAIIVVGVVVIVTVFTFPGIRSAC